jgi:hypothetical protein
MGLFFAVVEPGKHRMVVHQFIRQGLNLLRGQMQRRGYLVDFDYPSFAHVHPLLPRYGWRGVYHFGLEKSRCSISQAANNRVYKEVFKSVGQTTSPSSRAWRGTTFTWLHHHSRERYRARTTWLPNGNDRLKGTVAICGCRWLDVDVLEGLQEPLFGRRGCLL